MVMIGFRVRLEVISLVHATTLDTVGLRVRLLVILLAFLWSQLRLD